MTFYFLVVNTTKSIWSTVIWGILWYVDSLSPSLIHTHAHTHSSSLSTQLVAIKHLHLLLSRNTLHIPVIFKAFVFLSCHNPPLPFFSHNPRHFLLGNDTKQHVKSLSKLLPDFSDILTAYGVLMCWKYGRKLPDAYRVRKFQSDGGLWFRFAT